MEHLKRPLGRGTGVEMGVKDAEIGGIGVGSQVGIGVGEIGLGGGDNGVRSLV